jgi:hypothetical protein
MKRTSISRMSFCCPQPPEGGLISFQFNPPLGGKGAKKWMRRKLT